MIMFLFDHVQQADGSFPRDSELDGAVAPDTFGLSEIDQDAYPLLMAQEAGFAGEVSFYRNHIRRAADFIVDHGPNYGVERWEEHPGYSPSTLAAEIAGLAQAQYVRLVRDLQTGALLDQPTIIRARYVTSGIPAVVPLTIDSPAAGAITPTATTSVRGTTAPRARVEIAASQPGSATNITVVVDTVADARGAFEATIPTPPGATLITATATVGRRASGWAQETVTAAYQSLSAGYDNVGTTSDGDTSPGDFDGVGDSYSAQALSGGTPYALTPGSTVTIDGVALIWPDAPAGQPDNVVAGGQAFDLSGSGSTLGFLGAAAFGAATGTGSITYTDGTTQPFTLTFSDWASSTAAPGTSIVTTTNRWNTPTGSNGGGGVRNVYFASVPLQAGKTVAFATLPDVSTGVGVFTAMHIFAMAIGGA